ncbi:MAG: LapA family protein [Opitutaceae bacterium]
MPASFIIVPAVVIGLIAWLAAWWCTRGSKNVSPRDEMGRLRNHAAWLEQRLDTARQERWDREMILCLSDQLGAACHELARAQGGNRRHHVASQR